MLHWVSKWLWNCWQIFGPLPY